MEDDTYSADAPILKEPLTGFPTATAAWEALLEIVERTGWAWYPDDEDDPDGPHSLTPLPVNMQRLAHYYGLEKGKPGTVYDNDGQAWTVE